MNLSIAPFSFEEMRIRYERRDPRPEDVREIHELKSVIDAQDKDLRNLTEQLRGIQMHRGYAKDSDHLANDFEQIDESSSESVVQMAPVMLRKMKKSIINCDVIYEEENEG